MTPYPQLIFYPPPLEAWGTSSALSEPLSKLYEKSYCLLTCTIGNFGASLFVLFVKKILDRSNVIFLLKEIINTKRDLTLLTLIFKNQNHIDHDHNLLSAKILLPSDWPHCFFEISSSPLSLAISFKIHRYFKSFTII